MAWFIKRFLSRFILKVKTDLNMKNLLSLLILAQMSLRKILSSRRSASSFRRSLFSSLKSNNT